MADARLSELWTTIHRLHGRHQLERERRILAEAAGRWAPAGVHSILDIGCGDGGRTLELSRLFPGARVVGVDVNAELIDEARARCRGAPIELVAGDFCAGVPLPAAAFDLIHVRFALHLFEPARRDRFFDEMARLSRSGGIAFVEDHDSQLQLTYPPCPFLERMRVFAARLREQAGLDVEIGRKLPHLLAAHGFEDIHIDLSSLDTLLMGPADFVELMSAQAELLAILVPGSLTAAELREGRAELMRWATAGGALSLSAACVVTARREELGR
ncbi:MAG: methyltransferase domain-containing protein [Polyangiaceae bacterium]|nr:methyltransferase domain-containing protein [Polyangiaceae bacterium]